MILYHGTNISFERIDLTKCMPYKDFGRGFYTTNLKEQAWRMARRRAKVSGGCPIVMAYEVPNNLVNLPDLHCRVFDDKPTMEWALFVKNNRDKSNKDIASPECNLDNKYDIVVGPVANDTVGLLIKQFIRGTIDVEYLQREFDFGKLTNQYTFHTERAVQFLKRVHIEYDQPATGND